MADADTTSGSTGTYVVVGDTTVARRVCASLVALGCAVRHAPRPDDEELRALLDQPPVAGIAVLLQDDVVALRYALAAAHLQPDAPMVATIFDRTIGDQLARFLPQCDVTSPADLAAASLAGPCVAPDLLAVTSTREPRGIRAAGDVLDEVPVAVPRRMVWQRWAGQLTAVLRTHETGTRILLAGLLGLAAVLLGDWAWLTFGEGKGTIDAFHEAVRVVTTVGPAADPHGNEAYAAIASTAMLATIVFTAMFTAGVVDRLLGPRLTALLGPRSLPRSGHVIVVGLGQVGLRLCRELRDLGIPVVGVERDTNARNLRLVRDLNIPAVVGDGGDRRLLERVGVRRAVALAAVGSDDRDNVAVSLAVQDIAPGLRLVLRAGEREVLAETGSLLPLGVIRDVTSLSATYVLARLLGREPLGVVAGAVHVHLRLTDGKFEELPIASPGGCRHAPVTGVGTGMR
ncbi:MULTISPECIES: potassium channel family protein [unclassified Rhodococcus (in: high G+C Gram-positive bacteria)]|uniref:potassium channel family protein n=1 Tax=unclassified Rhodococcus (in: high G+C Gram-positive bacteria) TaxID=192944 RepID=UPI000929A3B9|nr:NAD(P)-binding protein [Rhodococcus sp. M8]OLL21486.1 portal protein [Rhodococcus sp. M8]QPG44167.1 NAD-binding protein [Rhodococcus sp. M8]